MALNLFLGLGLPPLMLFESLRQKVAILMVLMDSYLSYGDFCGSRMPFLEFRFVWGMQGHQVSDFMGLDVKYSSDL